MTVDAPLVQMRGIYKRFGGVHAVEDMNLTLYAGEVLGLLGHNGAGKSTLMKILAGAYPLDEGEITVSGSPVQISSPRDAKRVGIEAIYQTLALADNLSATANIFFGREIVNRFGMLDEARMERDAMSVVQRLNPHFQNFHTPVGSLSGGQRQAVAIARTLQFNAKIIIMDEPTAALGPHETQMVGTSHSPAQIGGHRHHHDQSRPARRFRSFRSRERHEEWPTCLDGRGRRHHQGPSAGNDHSRQTAGRLLCARHVSDFG